MANLNKVLLIGNLCRDPEIRHTAKGTAVGEISLAINRTIQTDDGKRDEVTFVNVTVWGRLAEISGEYLKKGRPVFIEGRLHLETWEDRDSGQKRSRLKVIGESVQFLGSKDDVGRPVDRAPAPIAASVSSRQAPAPSRQDPDLDAEPEDIPF